jgi:phosphoribosylglycinamide formyltransferase-1
MSECFIAEALEPLTGEVDTARMALGEPGLPAAFRWRGRRIEVLEVLRSWRETGPCSHGSRELYLRKHWFELATSCGRVRIYFERQPRRGKKGHRWWLYSMEGGADKA